MALVWYLKGPRFILAHEQKYPLPLDLTWWAIAIAWQLGLFCYVPKKRKKERVSQEMDAIR
jgi:hypothetical protein